MVDPGVDVYLATADQVAVGVEGVKEFIRVGLGHGFDPGIFDDPAEAVQSRDVIPGILFS